MVIRFGIDDLGLTNEELGMTNEELGIDKLGGFSTTLELTKL